jgi:hypothetical protein
MVVVQVVLWLWQVVLGSVLVPATVVALLWWLGVCPQRCLEATFALALGLGQHLRVEMWWWRRPMLVRLVCLVKWFCRRAQRRPGRPAGWLLAQVLQSVVLGATSP